MQKKLLVLSFMEGAAVMVAELCGARLLAPVFGSSLYVWSSVMGITLVALAMGYFFGGYFSTQENHQKKRLTLILLIASLFILAMPLIAHYLVPRISYLPFLTGVIVSSLCLLFFPVFFLGASSPFFIVLQTQNQNNSGRVSGTVYAVSTFGGILATFLCGFWLIPAIGLYACLISTGLLLLASSALILRRVNTTVFIILPILGYLNFQLLFQKNKLLLASDGLLGRLEVKDVIEKNGDTLRYMALNGIIQTQVYLHSSKKTGDYLSLIDTLVKKQSQQKNALLLGLGAGAAANMLVKKNYTVDAVEFDERIISTANNLFFLDKRVNTTCQDARYYLNHTCKKYDLFFFDVFKAEEQPGHVITKQSLSQLKNNCNDSSFLIINWHGYLQGETGKGTSLLHHTLTQAGFHVKLCATSKNEDFRNLIFVAALHPLPKLPYEITDFTLTETPINSDNNQLMESYNALANKKWRQNYLRYYQMQ